MQQAGGGSGFFLVNRPSGMDGGYKQAGEDACGSGKLSLKFSLKSGLPELQTVSLSLSGHMGAKAGALLPGASGRIRSLRRGIRAAASRRRCFGRAQKIGIVDTPGLSWETAADLSRGTTAQATQNGVHEARPERRTSTAHLESNSDQVCSLHWNSVELIRDDDNNNLTVSDAPICNGDLNVLRLVSSSHNGQRCPSLLSLLSSIGSTCVLFEQHESMCCFIVQRK